MLTPYCYLKYSTLIYSYVGKNIILSSSVVEQSAVNRLVVGSSPTWGAFQKENMYDRTI